MRFHQTHRFLQDFPSGLHLIHRGRTWSRRTVVWQNGQWDTYPLILSYPFYVLVLLDVICMISIPLCITIVKIPFRCLVYNCGWAGNDVNNQPNIEKKCFHQSPWRPPGYKDLWSFHSFATTTMRFSVVGTVVALASVAQAHFQLQYPAPRGVFVQNNEPTFCGQSKFFIN